MIVRYGFGNNLMDEHLDDCHFRRVLDNMEGGISIGGRKIMLVAVHKEEL